MFVIPLRGIFIIRSLLQKGGFAVKESGVYSVRNQGVNDTEMKNKALENAELITALSTCIL